MTLERREHLISQETESIVMEIEFPIKRQSQFVTSDSHDFGEYHMWRFFAYSYGEAFEVMWDAAYVRPTDDLNPPLLFLCRQSVELSMKDAISALSNQRPPQSHDLSKLWSRLRRALKEFGQPMSDAFSESVSETIRILDEHDNTGDRFRYPESSKSKRYPSTCVELEGLYRAHYRVTTYCEAISVMIEENAWFRS